MISVNSSQIVKLCLLYHILLHPVYLPYIYLFICENFKLQRYFLILIVHSQTTVYCGLMCLKVYLHCTRKTNWLKQPIVLFMMWTTIILVKLIEFWFRLNNVSVGPTAIIG